MKRLYKFTAVTLVTAFIFITMCFPASAATEYGLYGQGGLYPPFSEKQLEDYTCMFIPLDVGSDGIYKGMYVRVPSEYQARIVFTDSEGSSSGKYCYYVQVMGDTSTSATIYYSYFDDLATWRKSYTGNIQRSCEMTYYSSTGKYYGISPLINSDNCYIDNDSVFHRWVTDSEGYDNSIYASDSFLQGPGYTYHVYAPLVSTSDAWAYNYGYETEEEQQEAIEQSRYDEQNKIIKEGFTVLENSINNMGNKIEGAITQAVDDILNAGSDMPTLDTNNDWMNDSLTKVNEWVSSLEAFEEQMDAAEEENAENMANAKSFLSSFFSKIPKGIIAVLTLALVMIVVVKAVGR